MLKPVPPPEDFDLIRSLETQVETLDAQMHATAALAYFAFEQLERLCRRLDLPSPAGETLARLNAHDPSQDGLSPDMLSRRVRAMAMLTEQLTWAREKGQID